MIMLVKLTGWRSEKKLNQVVPLSQSETKLTTFRRVLVVCLMILYERSWPSLLITVNEIRDKIAVCCDKCDIGTLFWNLTYCLFQNLVLNKKMQHKIWDFWTNTSTREVCLRRWAWTRNLVTVLVSLVQAITWWILECTFAWI